MLKKRYTPTTKEQLERAKDGWFYEFVWTKRWHHVSQVDGYRKKHERVVKIMRWVDNNEGKILLIDIPLLVVIALLPLVDSRYSWFAFYNEYIWAQVALNIIATVILSFTILCCSPFVLWRFERKYQFICDSADGLSKGIIYDTEGHKHIFKNDL